MSRKRRKQPLRSSSFCSADFINMPFPYSWKNSAFLITTTLWAAEVFLKKTTQPHTNVAYKLWFFRAILQNNLFNSECPYASYLWNLKACLTIQNQETVFSLFYHLHTNIWEIKGKGKLEQWSRKMGYITSHFLAFFGENTIGSFSFCLPE